MTPQDWQALFDRAQTLLKAGDPEGAEQLLRPAVDTSAPTLLWRSLGLALRQQGKLEESLAIQQRVVGALPGDMEARFDLAETLLLTGQFAHGWREYRFRYRLSFSKQFERKVQQPRWDGRPIPGRTLLIHDEQGFGDTLQFMRLIPWARRQSGARIVLEVVPQLLPLAQRMGGFDQVIVRGELPPPFDQHCELMSLPQALKLELTDLPAGPVPYLLPDPARVEHWRQRLAGLPRPLVALVWAGNPAHANDSNRSLPLSALAPLARPDIGFVALQKGPAAAQAGTPPAGMSLLALDAEIRDFEDTAAILTVADLLITVDSSPVHLAGALGRPAWVLLPFIPDWRWLTGRDDSPWYPSVRLFRQPARNDWPGALAAMSAALDVWKATQC